MTFWNMIEPMKKSEGSPKGARAMRGNERGGSSKARRKTRERSTPAQRAVISDKANLNDLLGPLLRKKSIRKRKR